MLWLPGRQKYVSHHRASLKDTPCQRLRGEASGLLCAGTAAACGKVLGTLLRDGSWMNEANLTAVGAQKNSSAVLQVDWRLAPAELPQASFRVDH